MHREIAVSALLLVGCGEQARSAPRRDVVSGRAASAADPSESLLFTVSEIVEQRAARVGYAGLTQPERTFYCIWWLEAEVNNGGFDQYFFNSAGDNAEDTVAALGRIGAHRSAGILKRAMAVFASGVPSRDRLARQTQLQAMGTDQREQFKALDAEFYKYSDNLSELLARYAKAHEDHFTTPQ